MVTGTTLSLNTNCETAFNGMLVKFIRLEIHEIKIKDEPPLEITTTIEEIASPTEGKLSRTTVLRSRLYSNRLLFLQKQKMNS